MLCIFKNPCKTCRIIISDISLLSWTTCQEVPVSHLMRSFTSSAALYHSWPHLGVASTISFRHFYSIYCKDVCYWSSVLLGTFCLQNNRAFQFMGQYHSTDQQKPAQGRFSSPLMTQIYPYKIHVKYCHPFERFFWWKILLNQHHPSTEFIHHNVIWLWNC